MKPQMFLKSLCQRFALLCRPIELCAGVELSCRPNQGRKRCQKHPRAGKPFIPNTRAMHHRGYTREIQCAERRSRALKDMVQLRVCMSNPISRESLRRGALKIAMYILRVLQSERTAGRIRFQVCPDIIFYILNKISSNVAYFIGCKILLNSYVRYLYLV